MLTNAPEDDIGISVSWELIYNVILKEHKYRLLSYPWGLHICTVYDARNANVDVDKFLSYMRDYISAANKANAEDYRRCFDISGPGLADPSGVWEHEAYLRTDNEDEEDMDHLREKDREDSSYYRYIFYGLVGDELVPYSIIYVKKPQSS